MNCLFTPVLSRCVLKYSLCSDALRCAALRCAALRCVLTLRCAALRCARVGAVLVCALCLCNRYDGAMGERASVLDELAPDAVVMADPDPAFVRHVERYQSKR